MLKQADADEQKVEAAYDLLLMQSLNKRRAGQVTDSRVRFADVARPKVVRSRERRCGAPAPEPAAPHAQRPQREALRAGRDP